MGPVEHPVNGGCALILPVHPQQPASEAEGPEAAARVVWLYQKHEKIHPRTVKGWYQRWRWALVWITQLLFYGLPWLPWNGRPAVLLDLQARRFYIFDLVLYPQDFIYLAGLLIIAAYTLFLFTAVAGRLWCGYACPQTVYTEIFMWIERRLEGNRSERIKRDQGGWTFDKLWRKSLKQGAWIALSLWTGLTFVGYFTPIRQLWAESFTLAFGPWEWFWVLFYGLATYGFAGHLREQVCKYMCPYARFQSAMFDKDTLVITYDQALGEPRGSRGRREDHEGKGLGRCIDCGLCVQVCPTGIDIRQGLQYECIGCAACIDVCDSVMDKMHYPRGLVRYDTQNHMALSGSGPSVWRRVLRPRVLVYGSILALIVAGMIASLALRHPFRVDVIRDRASLARLGPDGQVQNVYRLQLMNASEQPQLFRFTAEGLDGLRLVSQALDGDGVSASARVEGSQARWVAVTLELPPEAHQQLKPGSHPVSMVVQVFDGTGGPSLGSIKERSTFIVPR